MNTSRRVALITGAARGQGRSHAVHLAGRGWDIIGIDLCAQTEHIDYPLATLEDLHNTEILVRAGGGRCVATVADVRSLTAMRTAVCHGVQELGRLDAVIANAGILGWGTAEDDEEACFREIIDVNLTGVWNTVQASVPYLLENCRGAVVITSSTRGVSGRGADGSASADAYCASKHGVIGLCKAFSNWLAPHGVRVNAIMPAAVRTPMIVNEAAQQALSNLDVEGSDLSNLLDTELLEPAEISGLVCYLLSDEARNITGTSIPIDAGYLAK